MPFFLAGSVVALKILKDWKAIRDFEMWSRVFTGSGCGEASYPLENENPSIRMAAFLSLAVISLPEIFSRIGRKGSRHYLLSLLSLAVITSLT